MTHHLIHLIHSWTIARSPGHGSCRWLMLLLGLVAFSGAGGCVDCEKRFCRGLRVSSVQLMSIADRCCLEPDLPGCEDPERFFQQVLERLMLAYDACHEDNLERMLDILDELLRMFPLFSVRSLCDEHLALDEALRDWLEDRCALYRNETTFFGPRDSVALTALVSLDQPRVSGSEAVFHAFQPGSLVAIDAWFAAGRSTLDGGVTLGPARPLPGGGRIIPVLDALFEFDLAGRRSVQRLSSTPRPGVGPRPAGWIVLDDSGVGRFGVQLHVDGILPDVNGPIWFECPVTLVRSQLMMKSPAGGEAFELFPVAPSVRQRFDILDDPLDPTSSSDDSSDDYGFDPCEHVDGTTRRALGWLHRLRIVFPDCFSAVDARESLRSPRAMPPRFEPRSGADPSDSGAPSGFEFA